MIKETAQGARAVAVVMWYLLCGCQVLGAILCATPDMREHIHEQEKAKQ